MEASEGAHAFSLALEISSSFAGDLTLASSRASCCVWGESRFFWLTYGLVSRSYSFSFRLLANLLSFYSVGTITNFGAVFTSALSFYSILTTG